MEVYILQSRWLNVLNSTFSLFDRLLGCNVLKDDKDGKQGSQRIK